MLIAIISHAISSKYCIIPDFKANCTSPGILIPFSKLPETIFIGENVDLLAQSGFLCIQLNELQYFNKSITFSGSPSTLELSSNGKSYIKSLSISANSTFSLICSNKDFSKANFK